MVLVTREVLEFRESASADCFPNPSKSRRERKVLPSVGKTEKLALSLESGLGPFCVHKSLPDLTMVTQVSHLSVPPENGNKSVR